MSADLRNVAISSIRENPVALRAVDKDDLQYNSLRSSVGKVGIQLPISVREKKDEEGTSYFEIIDGLHRYSAAVDNGLESIPVSVTSADDASALELQIMGNICRIDTAPAAYAQQLKRMFAMNPTLTSAELADKVCQSQTWVNQRLSLTKLAEAVQGLVDSGKISLANAYSLAKLPKEEQGNFVDTAMTMTPGEFGPTVQVRAKELRDAARQGREATPQTFSAVAFLRKVGEIKAERENTTFGPSVLSASSATTASDGWKAALAWVLSLDPASVQKQEANYNSRQAQKEEAKNKAAIERADKKAAEAAEAAAKVKAAVTG